MVFMSPPCQFHNMVIDLVIARIESVRCLSNPACCTFWPAFGCCACQTQFEIVVFSVFNCKKLKKLEICNKRFFEVCTKTLVKCFIPKKQLSYACTAPKCWLKYTTPAIGNVVDKLRKTRQALLFGMVWSRDLNNNSGIDNYGKECKS